METDDYVAIRRVQSAYADVVIDTMKGDPLRLVGPTDVGAFISGAISGFDFFEFVVLNTVIDVGQPDGASDADTATTRMYMNELRRGAARRDAESGRFTVVYGLYQDHMRRVDGKWWFAHRRYQALARTAQEFDVFPFPAVTNWSDIA